MNRVAFDEWLRIAAHRVCEMYPDLLDKRDLMFIRGSDNLPEGVQAYCHLDFVPEDYESIRPFRDDQYDLTEDDFGHFIQIAYDHYNWTGCVPGFEDYELLCTITHELIHSAVFEDGHRKRFITLAKQMKMCRYNNSWRISGFTDEFRAANAHILDELGPAPRPTVEGI